MSEQIDIKVTGKSEAEVAHEMAIQLLVSVEGKTLKGLTRAEYLNAHVQCVEALRMIRVG